jgi:protein phosphatase 2C family protein 2/3
MSDSPPSPSPSSPPEQKSDDPSKLEDEDLLLSTDLNLQKRNIRSVSLINPSPECSGDHSIYFVRDDQKFNLLLRTGECSLQGKRKTQEDNHTAWSNIPENNIRNKTEANTHEENPFAFFGVFDGHGGQHASDFVAEHLHVYLQEERLKNEMTKALDIAFRRIEEDFLQKAKKDDLKDGTTAIVAVFNEDKLIVGNIGDSELILSKNGKAHSLCPVHNPKRNQDEVKRIEAAGGRLFNERLAHPALNPAYFNIAVSRAVGDIFFKLGEYTRNNPSALIADPDIREYTLTGSEEFVLLACDGLWDVMTHQQVVDFLLPRLQENSDLDKVCEELANEALNLGSQDNITVLLVTLNKNSK